MVKNLPANAGDIRDAGSIPGLGRSPEEEMATCSRILAWEIPQTEEPRGLQSLGSQRVRFTTEHTHALSLQNVFLPFSKCVSVCVSLCV